MEKLTQRQKFSRSSDKYSELSANIRLNLKQFKNEVGQLNQKLEITTRTGNMYPSSPSAMNLLLIIILVEIWIAQF